MANNMDLNCTLFSTLLLLLLILSFSPSSYSQPTTAPIHDILGRNVTAANLYYFRNYTVGSYSGAGVALHPLRGRCASLVGLSASASDSGLPVRLVPFLNATVIYPGQRFRIALESPSPCGSSSEWALAELTRGTYVVSGSESLTASYFSVAVDGFGRYSLEYCGSCAPCKNLCLPLGLSPRAGLLRAPGNSFNFFFQKKVKKATPHDLLQTQ